MKNSDIEITNLTATEMAQGLRTGLWGATELIQKHLSRIESLNPQINAIVTYTPELALRQAFEIDRKIANQEPLGLLAGIPIAFKDTHDVAGVRTTYGSALFEHHVPNENELQVQRIIDAGAVCLGKTNVPEFAAGAHTFNSVFGITRNPYNTALSAGGSTGGGGAAVAARLMPISDGSDMAGSIRIPSGFNNVIGLRPTPGCVPIFPNSAPWNPLAVQGPIARSVEDIALMMKVMSGEDLRAPLSYEINQAVWEFPKLRDLSKLRIAYSTDFGGLIAISSEMQEAVLETVEVLRSLGASVEPALPDFTEADRIFKQWRAWEFVQGFGDLYSNQPLSLKQAIRENVEFGLGLSVSDLAATAELHSELHLNTYQFFNKFDALILPTTPVVPFLVDMEYPPQPNGSDYPSYLEWMSSCYLVTAAGNPSLAMPASLSADGLPRGIQIVGQHKNDAGLLSIGYALEQATHHVWNNPPQM